MTRLERDKSKIGRLRDNLAWRVANFMLNRVATPWYRDNVAEVIRLGFIEYRKAHNDD